MSPLVCYPYTDPPAVAHRLLSAGFVTFEELLAGSSSALDLSHICCLSSNQLFQALAGNSRRGVAGKDGSQEWRFWGCDFTEVQLSQPPGGYVWRLFLSVERIWMVFVAWILRKTCLNVSNIWPLNWHSVIFG